MKFSFNFDQIIDWMMIMILPEENMDKPYQDEALSKNSWVRTFDPSNTNSSEYVWHRDKKDRILTVLCGNGWKLQFDNQIPEVINIKDIIYIPKYTYHRLILGKDKLKLKIEEVE
jgi:hypothetical protein